MHCSRNSKSLGEIPPHGRKYHTLRSITAIAAVIFTVAANATFAQTNSPAQTPASAASSTSIEAQINSNDQAIAILNQQIAQYQAELNQIGADKTTLKQAIDTLDLRYRETEAGIAITQRQINLTQIQIQQLGGQISDTGQTINSQNAALAKELRNLQQTDGQSLIEQVLAAGGLNQAVNDVNAILEIQNGIQTNIQTLQTQKNSLANSQNLTIKKQNILSAQKATLIQEQQSLAATERQKSQLLAETNAKESVYEKLLAQAKEELASFSTFAQNAGGSKLLGNQTACDSWGCYYNQRDTAWGGDSLNGTQYTLAADGCLVTAMAMVMTHYGYKNVTPVTINSNPSNFAVYYPAYLLYTINVDGVSATRKASVIDRVLATGNPIIVGVRAYGGTHYVVLVSGSRGNYLMKDPYIQNGNDISFSSHYSLRSVFGIEKVIIG